MKRYVLTKDKEIRLSNEYDNLNANVDRTSDNLLDLLEVGDCVELKKDDEMFIFHIPDKESFYDVINDINDLTEEDKTYLAAIWKRQGDIMRRYEV